MSDSVIYLADGRDIRADASIGKVEFEGRTIQVAPLAAPFTHYGYGEILPIKLLSGEVFSTVLRPIDYQVHGAIIDIGAMRTEQSRRHNPDAVVIEHNHLTRIEYNSFSKEWIEASKA